MHLLHLVREVLFSRKRKRSIGRDINSPTPGFYRCTIKLLEFIQSTYSFTYSSINKVVKFRTHNQKKVKKNHMKKEIKKEKKHKWLILQHTIHHRKFAEEEKKRVENIEHSNCTENAI